MLTCAGLIVSASLICDVAAAPLPPEVAQELEYFVGQWHLEGEGAKGPMKSEWSIRWAPGRHCLIVEYARVEEGKTIRGNGLWGWDSATGELVYHAFYADRGLEHNRGKPTVQRGRYTGSLSGKAATGTCELRKEGPDQWTFKTDGVAASGLGELDVRFIRVKPDDTSTASKCPWEPVTGYWKFSDSTGYTAEVVWELAGDGPTVIGKWKDKDGTATELAGWRADQKTFVATGYGADGSYAEVHSTTVTESMIKGNMTKRWPNGSLMEGTWQLTKKSADEMPTLFVGTKDGEEVTIKGSFTRVK